MCRTFATLGSLGVPRACFCACAEHVKISCIRVLRVASYVFWYARACGVICMFVWYYCCSAFFDSMKDAVIATAVGEETIAQQVPNADYIPDVVVTRSQCGHISDPPVHVSGDDVIRVRTSRRTLIPRGTAVRVDVRNIFFRLVHEAQKHARGTPADPSAPASVGLRKQLS